MLREIYNDVVKNKLLDVFKYKNVMEIPRLVKVVVNVGHGVVDKAISDSIVSHLTIVAGQCPVINKARKSISNFKVREGMPLGCCVTLRSDRMYYFLERLIYVALPRSRDFHGLNPRSFDGCGNYSFGIPEHIIFPEIGYVDSNKIFGMDITICTTARHDIEAKELLTGLNFPFLEERH